MKPMKSLPAQGLINAALGAFYIIALAWLGFTFGPLIPKEDNFLMPATFLMVFVVSASIEASLVLGQPIMLYLDGKKSEAIKLLSITIGWMCALTFLSLLSMIIIRFN
jgi:hypothetical protein